MVPLPFINGNCVSSTSICCRDFFFNCHIKKLFSSILAGQILKLVWCSWLVFQPFCLTVITLFCTHVDNVWSEWCAYMYCSAILLMLLAFVVVGTLLDVQHKHATSMKKDLLYNVSTNVRHLVGSRDGRMTWTTVDESVVSTDTVTSDSQINDDQAVEDTESQRLQRPPNARLLVEAFRYKPGLICITSLLSLYHHCHLV